MNYGYYKTIEIKIDSDGVCVVSLNKPDVRNALVEEMREELKLFFKDANEDWNIKSIILTGKGSVFSAGGDLKSLQNLSPAQVKERLQESQELIKRILSLQKPVIAVVQGAAAGAGFSLALACDMIIASKSAVFIQSFIKIGVVPDLGALHFLPILVGRQRALEMMLLGEKMSAKEMVDMGVVNRVFEDNTILNEAMNIAKKLAENPRLSMSLIKNIANSKALIEIDRIFKLEQLAQEACFESDDFKEGIQAFFEKRKPAYH